VHPRTDRRRNSGQRELVESGTEMITANGFLITGDGATVR